MTACVVCGNDYPKAFTIETSEGERLSFDSFECAIHRVAPRCGHCGCAVIGHGVETEAGTFCCEHCARHSG